MLCDSHLKQGNPPTSRQGNFQTRIWQWFRNQEWSYCSDLSNMPGQQMHRPSFGVHPEVTLVQPEVTLVQPEVTCMQQHPARMTCPQQLFVILFCKLF